MPTIGQGFSLLACVAGIYIFVRGVILVLHQLTCTLIRNLEECSEPVNTRCETELYT
jgi:hypothetical protein